MYESSSSPVSRHEAEQLRRLAYPRSSAFNVVNPNPLDSHFKGESLVARARPSSLRPWAPMKCPFDLYQRRLFMSLQMWKMQITARQPARSWARSACCPLLGWCGPLRYKTAAHLSCIRTLAIRYCRALSCAHLWPTCSQSRRGVAHPGPHQVNHTIPSLRRGDVH